MSKAARELLRKEEDWRKGFETKVLGALSLGLAFTVFASYFEEMRSDMNMRFEQVDKRFEQVDKRFEDLRSDMNRRFSMLMWFIGIGFTLVTTIITGAFVLLK